MQVLCQNTFVYNVKITHLCRYRPVWLCYCVYKIVPFTANTFTSWSRIMQMWCSEFCVSHFRKCENEPTVSTFPSVCAHSSFEVYFKVVHLLGIKWLWNIWIAVHVPYRIKRVWNTINVYLFLFTEYVSTHTLRDSFHASSPWFWAHPLSCGVRRPTAYVLQHVRGRVGVRVTSFYPFYMWNGVFRLSVFTEDM